MRVLASGARGFGPSSEMPSSGCVRSVGPMDARDADDTDTAAPRLRHDARLAASAASVAEAPDVVAAGLALGAFLAPAADLLGRRTADYFTTLATLGAVDLTTARVIEPHLDALTILAQAGDLDLSPVGAGADSTWGVYAAEAPGHGLTAHTVGDGSWTIGGTKAWCSLADSVTHALVTAGTAEGSGLFAVPLRHDGVVVDSRSWISRGLSALRTSTVTFEDIPVVAVGAPGWYLSRPGFTWGGIAVAAAWFGGALALADSLRRAADRREPDQIALMSLGEVDVALHAARTALEHAAARIDAGEAAGEAGVILALRTRSVVVDAAERVVRVVGHALGPAPLTQDETHARRVADLTVYIRQHHAERDLAALGRHLLQAGGSGAPVGGAR